MAEQTIDLRVSFFEQLCEAADQSSWIPPEYMANDWVADCAHFLRTGEALASSPTAADIDKDAEIARLQEALATLEGRVDWAIGMYHDATRWSSEDDPDGVGTIRDYIFAPIRAALTQGKD